MSLEAVLKSSTRRAVSATKLQCARILLAVDQGELCQEFSAISSGSGDPPIWAGLRSARNFRVFHAASCHVSDSGSGARTTPIRSYR